MEAAGKLMSENTVGTPSGQSPTAFFQDMRPGPPGRYLSAEVRSPQTPSLPGQLRDHRPGRRSRRPLFGHRRLPLEHLLCIRKGSKYRIFEVRQNSLALNKTFTLGALSDRRAWDATRLPPGYDSLRTADALRRGRLRNTQPVRPPGQPPTGVFHHTRLRPLGRYLLAEICRPQTIPLTKSDEIPLTGQEESASSF